MSDIKGIVSSFFGLCTSNKGIIGCVFLTILLSSYLNAEEYVVVSDIPSSFNKIILKVVQKDLLQGKTVVPFSIEEQEDCIKKENCLEKVNSLYPQAVLLKLDLHETDINKEVFITLLDLKSTTVLNARYLECLDCSKIDLIAEIKSLNVFSKSDKNSGSYSLLRSPHKFNYPSKDFDSKLESISLSTTPPSTVFINGRSIGQTPLKISGSKKQKVDIDFININHKRLRKSFSFKKSASFKFNLTPIVASLSLTSSPSKANLYVNGKKIGKTPKVISKIKLTETLNINLELENYLDEQFTYAPKSEGKESLKINLIRGQGFLRVKHDTDATQVSVFINKDKNAIPLEDFNNGTLVLYAGKNNIRLQKGDVIRKKSFDIKIDEYVDWEVAFMDSVDISISF